MAWRRERRRNWRPAAVLAAVLLPLAASLPASPAAAAAAATGPPPPPPPPLECAASTGAELVAALADSTGCTTILLDGVVTLHDGDFPDNRDVHRARDVVLTSAAAASAPAVGHQHVAQRQWATLETSALLSRHVDVPAGVTLALSDLHVAGGARVLGDAMPAERPLSVFSLQDGAAATVTRCNVRLAPASCPAGSDADNLAWLHALDPGCQSAPAPGGGGVEVTAATLPVDALHLSAEHTGAAAAAAGNVTTRLPARRPKAARVTVKNSTLWCTRYTEAGVAAAAGDAGGAAAGRAAALVTARVWSGAELAAALDRTGSRTVLIAADEVTLPPPVTDALDGPEALIQDREVILRGRQPAPRAGRAAERSALARVLIPPAPAGDAGHARQCKQPLLRAGAGGSVTLTDLTLVAADPGCALMPLGPRAVCTLNGGAAPFSSQLRGAILPAGMAGSEPGGQLSIKSVAVEFERCTPALAAAAAEIVRSAGPGAGAALMRVTASGDVADGPPPTGDDPAGLVLTCGRCEFDCRKPDVTLPTQIGLWNVTVACGAVARRGGGGGGGARGGPKTRAVGLDARAGGGSGGSGGDARAHSPTIVALAVTMGVAACLAAVAAVVAATTCVRARRARVAGGGAGGQPAPPPAPAAAPGGPPAEPAGDVASSSADDDDSARPSRGRRSRWAAKLWLSSGGGSGGGRGGDGDDKPDDGVPGAPEP